MTVYVVAVDGDGAARVAPVAEGDEGMTVADAVARMAAAPVPLGVALLELDRRERGGEVEAGA